MLFYCSKGFSLVELLVVMALTASISTALIQGSLPMIQEEKTIHKTAYDLQTIHFLEAHFSTLQTYLDKAQIISSATYAVEKAVQWKGSSFELGERMFLTVKKINDGPVVIMKLWNDTEFYDCAGVSVAAQQWTVNIVYVQQEKAGYSLRCTSFSKRPHTVKLLENIKEFSLDATGAPHHYALSLEVNIGQASQILPLIFTCRQCI